MRILLHLVVLVIAALMFTVPAFAQDNVSISCDHPLEVVENQIWVCAELNTSSLFSTSSVFLSIYPDMSPATSINSSRVRSIDDFDYGTLNDSTTYLTFKFNRRWGLDQTYLLFFYPNDLEHVDFIMVNGIDSISIDLYNETQVKVSITRSLVSIDQEQSCILDLHEDGSLHFNHCDPESGSDLATDMFSRLGSALSEAFSN